MPGPGPEPPHAHRLGPHVVGQRVVVRRVLRGQTGPSGGPAMSDVLGVMESWSAEVACVRDESGRLSTIPIADIVAGKPVPPRPSVRHRVSAEEAELRASSSWPALETEALGRWLLRAAGGYSSRANSVLAVGDPGVGFAEAEAVVRHFYGSRDLPAWAQVVVGSDVHREFEAAGWQYARPGEGDTSFQVASVAQVARATAREMPVDAPPVQLSPTVTAEWIATDDRAMSHGQTARDVLEGPEQVCFAVAPGAGSVVAAGRATLADDWVGISNVWVAPELRGRRLSVVVVRAMVGWAAERGASTAYLQVRGDNAAAVASYARLGFLPHHTYRYLMPS